MRILTIGQIFTRYVPNKIKRSVTLSYSFGQNGGASTILHKFTEKLNLLDDRSVVLIFFSYLSENLPNVNRHENLVPLSSNNT